MLDGGGRQVAGRENVSAESSETVNESLHRY